MRTHFVKTQNVMNLIGALGELERRSPVVPGLFLAHGHQGYGKTMSTQWYAVQSGAVYLRAQAAWTVNWMLQELCGRLGLAPEGITRNNFRQVREELYKRPRLVFLDEADYLIRERRMLDTVRDLYDMSGAAIVLVGMAGAKEAIARKSPQFWSRVSQEVEFTPLTAADVQVVAAELTDLKLEAAHAGQIQRQTEGNFRQTVVLLSQMETIVKSNPNPEIGRVVDLAAQKLRAMG
jgi:DNA transposition AAA+ family ATPase